MDGTMIYKGKIPEDPLPQIEVPKRFLEAAAMGLPPMTTRRWMLIVAVFGSSLALGLSLRNGLSRPQVVGFTCVIASLPMVTIFIEFILRFRSHD
jgi:hypothetical protein